MTGKAETFRRNSIIMSSGALINVLASLALYPIVTRLYSKEEFGILGLYVAIIGIISLAGTALYPTGLVIPKFRREFLAMLKLSLYLTIIITVITSIIIVIFNDLFINIFKLKHLSNIVYIIPVGVFLTSIHVIFTNLNIRKKQFIKNASSSVVSGSSGKILSIGYALGFNPSAFGLIISQVISILLSIMMLGINIILKDLKQLHVIQIKEVINVAVKYNKYPKHLLPANIVNKYSADLPIYILTAYFSPAVTGAFFLANSILSIPLNIIGTSISSVFLQRANELYNSDPKLMSEFAYNTYKYMLYLGVLAFGFIFGFGDILFAFIFGNEWLIAGQISQILSAYYIFKLVSGPLAKIYRVVGKEQYSLYVSIILAICRVAGIWMGVLSGDPILVIIYFTLGNLVGYLFNSIMVFKALKLSAIKPVTQSIFLIVVSFSCFYLLRLGFEHLVDLPV